MGYTGSPAQKHLKEQSKGNQTLGDLKACTQYDSVSKAIDFFFFHFHHLG